MGNLNVFAPDLPHELDVMIAGNAESLAGLDRFHDETNGFRNFGTAIHQVSDEDELPALRMPPRAALVGVVSQVRQQFCQLIEATMDVSDDIEWSVLMLEIIP